MNMMPQRRLPDASASEASIVGISDLIGGLTVAEGAAQGHTKESRSPHSHLSSSTKEIPTLRQLANNTASQAQRVQDLIGNAVLTELLATGASSLDLQVAKLSCLAFSLNDTADAIEETMVRSIASKLTTLGEKDARHVPSELLSHFDSKIHDIIKGTLDATRDNEILWRAAEECCNQTSTLTGTLRADDYHNLLEEASLQWPYDPDFESEEYYEHEDRLDIDEDYAAAFQEEALCRVKTRMRLHEKDTRDWIDFWVRALHNAPNGPTLFYPPASQHHQSLDLHVPGYLFRTFDARSQGTNNEMAMMSLAITKSPHRGTRTDNLSRDSQQVAEMLYMHLKGDCFAADDLVSWTSSLLFAIQYAIYRARRYQHHRSKIFVCAVDTSKFPAGQFVRDVSLLRAFHPHAHEKAQEFFDFRLTTEEYYNGEYLSQGRLNHKGRSCVFSFEQLIEAGLFEIYPKLGDKMGGELWAKRVSHLRHEWSTRQNTGDKEIELALKITQKCFKSFDQIDMSCLLLAFQNRGFPGTGK
jgi:hypothetical protein